jgi:hypothetical protein
MASISDVTRPAFAYDEATDTWVPVGIGPHSHTAANVGAVATSSFAAKGDLVAGTGAGTLSNLGVGANNTVLTADSSTATGLKWATPAGGGANWSLVNTGGTALSGSNTTTVSFTAKDKVFVYLVGARSAQTGISAFEVSIRVNGSSAGIYNYQGPYISVGSGYTSFTGALQSGSSATSVRFGEWSNNANSVISGSMFISGAATSGVKTIQFNSGAEPATGWGQDLIWGGGFIDTTATITSISIVQTQSQNFNGGTLFVYTSD